MRIKNLPGKKFIKRCIKFASALEKIGIGEGDTVSVMAFNTPEIFEAHYSVPMTGAILNTINTRLDAKTVAYIIDHSEAKSTYRRSTITLCNRESAYTN